MFKYSYPYTNILSTAVPTFTSLQFASTLSYGSMPYFYWSFPDGQTLNISTTQGVVNHWFVQVYSSPVTMQLNVSNQVSQQNTTVCICTVRSTIVKVISSHLTVMTRVYSYTSFRNAYCHLAIH